ncbi:AAA family ATPase [Brachyspira pulli]|uniref:AAA family ATPase n=2 Tax=Brachyspira pulli TaxID=310721 RepID=UPI0030053C1B
MIKSLSIENFRCFDKLQIDNIKKINFIIGENNCGKTTLLEAMTLISSSSRIGVIENIKSINRFIENKVEIKNLFHKFDYDNNISFNYNQEDDTNYEINISPIVKDNKKLSNDNVELNYNIIAIHNEEIQENNLTIPNINNTIYMMNRKAENIEDKKEIYIPSKIEYSTLTSYLIEILKNKNEAQLLEMISYFNKDIKAISVLNNDIYVNVEGINELVLLNLMGDGLKKYLSVILPIFVNKYSIISIDEIENGLHNKAIRHLLRSILTLSRNNDMQMFFTTHNYNVLRIISDIVTNEDYFKDLKDIINIINIYNTENEGFKTYNYDVDSAREFIENNSNQ